MSEVSAERTMRLGHRADATVPVSTYRLQLNASFTFADAAAQLPYLSALGVTHLYLSPILAATPGSTHFYDVVDHSRVSNELGGEAALRELAEGAHALGMGLICDLVPNHMSLPTPAYHNKALWSVLAEGAESPFSHWFDVDWTTGDPMLMPVLGSRIGTVLAADELTVETMTVPGHEDAGEVPVLRYYDHVFPLKPGTESLPMADLVQQQHYRLAYWRVTNEELNYRRFFDVGSLMAIRVEDEDVFNATHDVIVRLVNDGVLDGLRIDHPDGLADPAGYFERLAEATHDAWIVGEKILEDEESLPSSWKVAGTTGYDASWRVGALLRDPAGSSPLAGTLYRLTGDAMGTLPDMIDEGKREIIKESLSSEIHRLAMIAHEICHTDVRLRDHTWRALYDCLREMIITFDRYRAYVVAGVPIKHASLEAIDHAAAKAKRQLDPERHETLEVIVDLLKGAEVGSAGRTSDANRGELVTRFQQVCGAAMAKGMEDTAYYRWTHLLPLCEVGSPAGRFALPPASFHAWVTQQHMTFPHTMTCLTTHDTKRSEDVRARLGVLSEAPHTWDALVDGMREATAGRRRSAVDGRIENLWWQTLAGTFEPDADFGWDRLAQYLTKAMREAKSFTTWTAVNVEYETAVLDFARFSYESDEVRALLTEWHAQATSATRSATLSQKLIQLMMPGVSDVYQGTESVSLSLVDPDNRRPVDFEDLAAQLAKLDAGAKPRDLATEKLRVTSEALRMRREHSAAFVGSDSHYQPLPASSGHTVVFSRGVGEDTCICIATRAGMVLDSLGGWGDHTVHLPEGRWRDALTGNVVDGGTASLAAILDELPVALLVKAAAS